MVAQFYDVIDPVVCVPSCGELPRVYTRTTIQAHCIHTHERYKQNMSRSYSDSETTRSGSVSSPQAQAPPEPQQPWLQQQTIECDACIHSQRHKIYARKVWGVPLPGTRACSLYNWPWLGLEDGLTEVQKEARRQAEKDNEKSRTMMRRHVVSIHKPEVSDHRRQQQYHR